MRDAKKRMALALVRTGQALFLVAVVGAFVTLGMMLVLPALSR